MITTVNGKQKQDNYDKNDQWAATAAVASCHHIQI